MEEDKQEYKQTVKNLMRLASHEYDNLKLKKEGLEDYSQIQNSQFALARIEKILNSSSLILKLRTHSS